MAENAGKRKYYNGFQLGLGHLGEVSMAGTTMRSGKGRQKY